MNWTKPYYGVTHLREARRPFQATCASYDTFTEAKLFHTSHGFTPMEQRVFRASACGAEDHTELAKAWLEQRYLALNPTSQA